MTGPNDLVEIVQLRLAACRAVYELLVLVHCGKTPKL